MSPLEDGLSMQLLLVSRRQGSSSRHSTHPGDFTEKHRAKYLKFVKQSVRDGLKNGNFLQHIGHDIALFEAWLKGDSPTLTRFSFTPVKDDQAPFGFRLIDNDKFYSKDQRAAIRIVQLCAVGLQHKLETVALPRNEEFFMCSTFWPIWICLGLDVGYRSPYENYLLCTGWVDAFTVLREQLEGMNVRSATLITVKILKEEFMSTKKAQQILAKSPLSSVAEYRKMNLDEEEILERLEFSNLQHIFAKLENDLDLFKTIIKAKDEVRRFAK